MRIVVPGDPTYDDSRRISNARFNYRPSYRDHLDRLIRIKHQYDSGNFFDFDMGIPTS